MEKTRLYFLFLGTLAVAVSSSTLLMNPLITPFNPKPIYLVLFYWFTSFGFLLFLPVLYVLGTLVLEKSKNAGRSVLILSSVLFLLDLVYFASSWNYGIKYQGREHTSIVFFENLIGFGIVIGISLAGIRRSSLPHQRFAYLLLFILLGWCAFPYLGELP
jgi:hypothetical protein